MSSSLAWKLGANPMQLQFRGVQDRVHGTVRQVHFSRQPADGPASLRFWLLTSQGLHLVPDPRIVFRGSARARRITKSLQPLRGKGPPPFADGDLGNLEIQGNLLIG